MFEVWPGRDSLFADCGRPAQRQISARRESARRDARLELAACADRKELPHHRQLDEIAQARGKTVLQVALAWIMQQPGITSPIIGVNTVEQWSEMEGAIGWRLSEEEAGAA